MIQNKFYNTELEENQIQDSQTSMMQQAQNPCSHCETLVMCGEQDEIKEAKFIHVVKVVGVPIKMQLCPEHFNEIIELDSIDTDKVGN